MKPQTATAKPHDVVTVLEIVDVARRERLTKKQAAKRFGYHVSTLARKIVRAGIEWPFPTGTRPKNPDDPNRRIYAMPANELEARKAARQNLRLKEAVSIVAYAKERNLSMRQMADRLGIEQGSLHNKLQAAGVAWYRTHKPKKS